MKRQLIFSTFILFIMACAGSGSQSPSTPNQRVYSQKVMQTFSNTVAVGASISNNAVAESPGEKVTRLVGTHNMFERQALNGVKAADLIPTLDIKSGTTAIVGVDLFFWDTTAMSCDAGVQAVDQILALAQQRKATLVLGNVPPMKANQPCLNTINAAIEQKCTLQTQCYFLDLKSLFISLSTGGTVTYNGQTYVLKDIMHDQLHLNDLGTSIVAEMILGLF